MVAIDIIGYGFVPPHKAIVFVICCQQDTFKDWTIYRELTKFKTLHNDMVAHYPDIDKLPVMNTEDKSVENLEKMRVALNGWLLNIVIKPEFIHTEIMFHFLCSEANMIPPSIEIVSPIEPSGASVDDVFERNFRSNLHNRISEKENLNQSRHGSVGPHDERSIIDEIANIHAEIMFHRAEADKTHTIISLEAFDIIKVIGKGSFGKVFLVRYKAFNTLHAMKVLVKQEVFEEHQVEQTRIERSVLEKFHHPNIVGLSMAFQTTEKLFFVLDYCSGGELFFQLCKAGKFTESRAQHYAAQIILALGFIHDLNVMYRDLKPENVLFDHLGNVRLADFGCAKEDVTSATHGGITFCGTPEYVAPEIVLKRPHGKAVDWWSLGALLFEMLTGLPPFYCRSREEMFEKIVSGSIIFPKYLTKDARDIIVKLLNRDASKRLGSSDKDSADVKSHIFFSTMNWESLLHGKIPPPWVPAFKGENSVDTSEFDPEFTSMPVGSIYESVKHDVISDLDTNFTGFSFLDESSLHESHESSPLKKSLH